MLVKEKQKKYKIGKKDFDFSKSYVMGILNVTPDSFSDGGKFFSKDDAINHALHMIDEGADIIDIGGESTRPGSNPVSLDEELTRVIPVIEELLNRRPETTISIDTTKKVVAEEALKSGALIVNDISGSTFEPEILNVVSDFNAAIVIMHIKGKPKAMQEEPFYEDVFEEVYSFLSSQIALAEQTGVDKIIIDPGIGFGKRFEDNVELIRRLEEFSSIGYPLLIGLSRKSFFGQLLNLKSGNRDAATNALNAYAISKGARIIRTHNVKLGVETCKMMNTVYSD